MTSGANKQTIRGTTRFRLPHRNRSYAVTWLTDKPTLYLHPYTVRAFRKHSFQNTCSGVFPHQVSHDCALSRRHNLPVGLHWIESPSQHLLFETAAQNSAQQHLHRPQTEYSKTISQDRIESQVFFSKNAFQLMDIQGRHQKRLQPSAGFYEMRRRHMQPAGLLIGPELHKNISVFCFLCQMIPDVSGLGTGMINQTVGRLQKLRGAAGLYLCNCVNTNHSLFSILSLFM